LNYFGLVIVLSLKTTLEPIMQKRIVHTGEYHKFVGLEFMQVP